MKISAGSLIIGILSLPVIVFAQAFEEPTCDPNVDPGACNRAPPVWLQTSATQSGGFRISGDGWVNKITAAQLCLGRCISTWEDVGGGLTLPLDPIYFKPAYGDLIALSDMDGSSLNKVNAVAIGVEKDVSTGVPLSVTNFRNPLAFRWYLNSLPDGESATAAWLKGVYDPFTRKTNATFNVAGEVTSPKVRGTSVCIGTVCRTSWPTAATGNQNLQQVLTVGSDASAFTGTTYIGGVLTLGSSARMLEASLSETLLGGLVLASGSTATSLLNVASYTPPGPITPAVTRRFRVDEGANVTTDGNVISRDTIAGVHGVFLDLAEGTGAILSRGGLAGNFAGPVAVNGNLSLGSTTTINPEIRTSQHLNIILDADGTGSAKEFRIKKNAMTNPNLLLLDSFGNLTISGQLNTGMGMNGLFDTLTLRATSPLISLGTSTSDAIDRTVKIQHLNTASTSQKAHLEVQGNVIMDQNQYMKALTPTLYLGTSSGDVSDRTLWIDHWNNDPSRKASLRVNGDISTPNDMWLLGTAPRILLGTSSTDANNHTLIIEHRNHSKVANLSVSGSVFSSGVYALEYHGSGGAMNIGDNDSMLYINTGNAIATVNGSMNFPNGSICLDNGGGACDSWTPVKGKIRMDNWTSSTSDIAEPFQSDESLMAGTVVRSVGYTRVAKTQSTYDRQVIGIVSTAPGGVLGDYSPEDTLVAVTGRVPTNVTNEAGPIVVGDLLTTSSIPGVAMKCSEFSKCVGAIIGKALESLNASTGKILVLVNLQ